MKYNLPNQKIKKPSISFFCPAYNDEKNLPRLIPKVIHLLKKVTSAFEIVIIDDCSPDNTAIVADKLAKHYRPFIKVVHHQQNRDYGGALRSGFRVANRYEYIFYTDGDYQYDVNDLKKMLKLVPVYDAVIGVRKRHSFNWRRILQSKLYNFFVRSLFNIQTQDVGCSLRLIKKEYVSRIPFYSTSTFVQVEVLLGLKKLGARVKQIPVNHTRRMYGRASGGKPSVILHTLIDIAKAYLRQIRH